MLTLRAIDQRSAKFFSDIEFIYSVRQDPEVIKQSISGYLPTPMQHIGWFAQRDLTNSPIYIIESAGYIRLDDCRDGKEVSIAILPEYRRLGYATQAIKSVCNKWGYFALIKKGNIASIKAFTKGGFVEVEQKNGILKMEKKIHL